MYRSTVLVLLCVGAFIAPQAVSAHQPRFVEIDQHDSVTVTDPALSQAFYGTLTGYPHTYELHFDTDTELHVELLSPDIEKPLTKELSLIVLHRMDRDTEAVTRLSGGAASWDSTFEWWGGDSYLNGPTFSKTLPPGNYAIEVSTPINEGKYVLVMGTREEFSLLNYAGTLRDIAKVKAFFGKSSLAIMETPLVYVPLLVVVLIGWFVYRRLRRT